MTAVKLKIEPVILSVFFDENKNNIRIEDLQYIDDTSKYYFRNYKTNGYELYTFYEFLEEMDGVRISQLNFPKSSNFKFTSNNTDILFNFIESNEEKDFAKELISKGVTRELEIITRCPICGKLHSVKKRSIKQNHSLICTSCARKIVGLKITEKTYLKDLVPELKNYFSENNRQPFDNFVVLGTNETINVRCSRCGKPVVKTIQGIVDKGIFCPFHSKENTDLPNKCLKIVYPRLAKMWDEGGNDKSSSEVYASSRTKGYFVCHGGGIPHKFYQGIDVMAAAEKNNRLGCPICANKEVYMGINDFATLFPKLVQDWDYQRNPLPPEKTLCSNTSSVYLKCLRCGRIHSKTIPSLKERDFGSLCNSCARIVSMRSEGKSFTLREMYPDIADMLDNAPNAQKSDYLSPSSHGYFNFYCDGKSRGLKSHIFNASLINVVACRDNRYHGCPVCAGRQVVTGVNDFKTLNPVGASMWNYRLNGVLPEEVYAYSPEMYHFICKNGHHFTRDPLHMMRSIGSSTNGCPVCYGRRVIVGVNDLGTKLPFTLQKWDYDLNDFTPKDVTEGSNRKMLARCQVKSCSNVYETNVYLWSHNLVRRCPDCRKSQISTDEQNIADKLYSWGCAVEQQYPIAGGKYLLDAYLYKQNIAIEYNGVYWHSANKRGRDYHLDKYETAKKFGIELYYIWSDDYESKPDLVINLLKQKVFDVESEFSPEDCTLSFIDRDEAKSFIEENGLLDFNSYSFKGEYEYLGIYIGETLSAVCQLREVGEDTIEIFGYCEKFIVPNRMGMLEKFIKTNTGYHIMRVVHERASILNTLDRVGVLSGDVSPRGFYVLGTKRSIELPSYLDKEEYNGKSIEQISLDTGLEIVYNAGYEVWEKQL